MVLSSSSKPAATSKAPFLKVFPTGAALGAEVKGLDLRDVILSEGESGKGGESGERRRREEREQLAVAAILDAWHAHGVLLFRDQRGLSPDGLLAFSRKFGDLDLAPIQETGRRFVEGRPELYIVSNVLDAKGKPIGALGHGEAAWHTDMSYQDTPPKASMLHALEVPESGGDTSFACMYGAFDSLPRRLKEKVEGLRVKHDATYNSGGLARAGIEVTDDPRRSPGAIHPLVVTHPQTRRRCLYLGRRMMAWVEGLDLESSALLLDELWSYATMPSLVWTQEWRVGDLVFWDNRCTLHRRDPFPAEARRVMHRTQIKGAEPPMAGLGGGGGGRGGVRGTGNGRRGSVSVAAVAAARFPAAVAARPRAPVSSSPLLLLRQRCFLVR